MAYNPLLNPHPVSGPLTDAQLRALAVSISGTVTANAGSGTQAVSIASMPTTPVTGTFWQATQPISGNVGVTGSVAVTGPLTDTQLRATALPVSGTFWQATQPVSGTVTVGNASIAVTGTFFQATQPISAASLPLPAGASTETTLAAMNTKTPALGQGLMAASQPVVIASNQSTVNVSVASAGTISTVNSTATNLAANGVFTGTSEDVAGYSTIAVTVFASHASATNGLSIQQSSDGTNWDLTDTYTVPATSGKTFNFAVAARFYRLVYTNGATATTSLRIQTLYTAVAKRGSSVRPQDNRGNDNDMEEVIGYGSLYNEVTDQWSRARGSAKGVQPTIAQAIQPLRDAGRVIFSAATVVAGVTAVTAEAMLSMVPVRDGVAGAAATSFAVTSGKRLRLSLLNGGLTNTAAAAISARLVVRYSATGAVTTASPILTIVTLHAPAALAQTGDHEDIIIPDGVEFSGTMQIGISQVANVATGTVRVSVIGFEY